LYIGEKRKDDRSEFIPWAKGRGSDFVLILRSK
jgi:hypothetical protein